MCNYRRILDRFFRLMLLFTVAGASNFVVAAGTCYQWKVAAGTPADSGWLGSASAAAQAYVANCNSLSPGYKCTTVCSTNCNYSVSSLSVATFPAYNLTVSWTGNLNGSGSFTPAVTNRVNPEGCPDCPVLGEEWTNTGTGSISSAPALLCIDGCNFKKAGVGLGFPSLNSYAQVYQSQGTACSQTSSGGTPVSGDSDGCITNTSTGAIACVDETRKNCGLFNGDRVCIDTIAPGTCVSFSSGGAACVTDSSGNVTTPPAPDNGTSGTPATPTGVVQAQGTTVNYYNSSTVSSSSTTVVSSAPTGGNPIGGSGDGEGEEGGGSASGGATCAAAPVCSGDPVGCATLEQEWRNRCVEVGSASDIQTQTGETGGSDFPGESLAVGSINSAGWLGAGGCMADISVDLGSFGSVTIPLSEWCSLFSIAGIIVMIMAYIGAARIVVGGF